MDKKVLLSNLEEALKQQTGVRERLQGRVGNPSLEENGDILANIIVHCDHVLGRIREEIEKVTVAIAKEEKDGPVE